MVFLIFSGEIISRNISSANMTLNYYYHQECTWILDSRVERQLKVQLATLQNRESSKEYCMTPFRYKNE
jgi:hypothetical protein